MGLTPPATVQQFKDQFGRDFVYGSDLSTVRDLDIQNALNSTSSIFNPCLFSTAPVGVAPNVTSEAIISYLNCSAHFLVLSIQGAGGLGKKGGGINSQGEGVVTGKGVGGVSINFSWPASVTESPVLSQFLKTSYGQLYLQILTAKLVGNVGVVSGETTDFESIVNPAF